MKSWNRHFPSTRRFRFFFAGLLFAFLSYATLFSLFSTARADEAEREEVYYQLNLFGEVFDKVRELYVDTPDSRELIAEALKGMLKGLDPHSSYLAPEDFRRSQGDISGEFGGLGIEFTMENDVVKVVTPIDNTPASRAGILSGDYITHLDGDSIEGISIFEAVDRMRGPVGEMIVLTVLRPSDDYRSFDVTIVRELIENNPVTSRLEEEVIYLRISEFNEKTVERSQDAIDEALVDLPFSQVDGLILDLRNNGGGVLHQAIGLADLFLDEGEIVSTRGRDPSQVRRSFAELGDALEGKPIVVMINGGSASASEIVAGALKDHERATLIGSRSYGKGSVQRIIPLNRGRDGALRITTELYYTPSGQSIQAQGIEPDVFVFQPPPEDANPDAYLIEGEAGLKGHLKADDNDEEETPSQPEAPEGADDDTDDDDATSRPTEPDAPDQELSSSYVPSEPEDDLQLAYALDWLRGTLDEASAEATTSSIP